MRVPVQAGQPGSEVAVVVAEGDIRMAIYIRGSFPPRMARPSIAAESEEASLMFEPETRSSRRRVEASAIRREAQGGRFAPSGGECFLWLLSLHEQRK